MGRKISGNIGRNHTEVINELKNSQHIVKTEEVQDGTLENIILGLKSNPYRTNVNEGMRKSFRRQRSEVKYANSSSRETEDL